MVVFYMGTGLCTSSPEVQELSASDDGSEESLASRHRALPEDIWGNSAQDRAHEHRFKETAG